MSVAIQMYTYNTGGKKLTLTLAVLFGEATAEGLSSVIELNALSLSRPSSGEPRISICDMAVDVCEPEDLLLRWCDSRRSITGEYEVPVAVESRSE